MSTVEQRAAETIAWADWAGPRNAIDRLNVADVIAAALAAAGLLADPTTSRTDEQQAVIDAAPAAAESLRVAHLHTNGCLCVGCEDRRAFLAAVDRLAAPGPKGAT